MTELVDAAVADFDDYLATVQECMVIPPPLVDGLRHYLHGRPTGSFLRAVLSNDLSEAVGRAHESSLAALGPLMRLIHNAMPSICHGSPERVNAWLGRTVRTQS